MIISKSLPINFRLISDSTYNSSDICGSYSDCFCEHVNYDENITLQFNHGSALTLKAYRYDDNTEVASQLMTSIGGGYYSLTFKPNEFVGDENIKVVYFKVFDASGELALSDCVVIGGCLVFEPIITSTPTSTWLDGFGSSRAAFTSKAGDVFNANSMVIDTIYSAYKLISVPTSKQGTGPETLNLNITTVNPGGRNIAISVIYWQTPFSSIIYQSLVFINTSTTAIVPFAFPAPSGVGDIGLIEVITEYGAGGSGSPSVSIEFTTGTVLWDFSDQLSEFTKCFDYECSITIFYKNTKNFDNILYEVIPQPTFQIVIEGQFQVEDEPQEQENLELSNGLIVMLRQNIITKRLLKTGYMPNHMHEKLRRILMHDSIRIEGTQDGQASFWRKIDEYETTPVNRYGLKMGEVWLTLYNSIEKNTL